jgi:hypothetical protein
MVLKKNYETWAMEKYLICARNWKRNGWKRFLHAIVQLELVAEALGA